MRTVSLIDMLSRMISSSRRAGAIVIAVEPDRGLPDALDQVEHVGAFLIAHGVAEDAPEQPDIVAQPGVFFERQGFVGAVGAKVGVGRRRGHDLGRHG